MAEPKNKSVSKKMLTADPSDKEKRTHPVLVLIAGFLSAFLLLFCCVCGGLAWWFQPEINDDPDLARQVMHEIVDIQIPDSYQPKGTIEWNVAFMMRLRGAYYERFVGEGVLSVLEVDSRLSGDDDVRRHIQKTLEEKGGGGTPLVIKDSETRQVMVDIAGREVPFTIEIGRDPPTGRTYHLIEGVFQGENGDVLLAMRVSDENWEESSIMAMLNSIGDPTGTEDSAD